MKHAGMKMARKGQGMTEYIIIVALVAIASIGVVTIFGNQIRALFSASTRQLQGENVDPSKAGDSTSEINKTIKDF